MEIRYSGDPFAKILNCTSTSHARYFPSETASIDENVEHVIIDNHLLVRFKYSGLLQ